MPSTKQALRYTHIYADNYSVGSVGISSEIVFFV